MGPILPTSFQDSVDVRETRGSRQSAGCPKGTDKGTQVSGKQAKVRPVSPAVFPRPLAWATAVFLSSQLTPFSFLPILTSPSPHRPLQVHPGHPLPSLSSPPSTPYARLTRQPGVCISCFGPVSPLQEEGCVFTVLVSLGLATVGAEFLTPE